MRILILVTLRMNYGQDDRIDMMIVMRFCSCNYFVFVHTQKVISRICLLSQSRGSNIKRPMRMLKRTSSGCETSVRSSEKLHRRKKTNIPRGPSLQSSTSTGQAGVRSSEASIAPSHTLEYRMPTTKCKILKQLSI